MVTKLEDYDPFSDKPENIRGLVRDTAVELGFPGLSLVARATGVPMTELSRLYNHNQIETRYLPILYTHFFGNVPPEQAKQFRVEHEP